MPVYEYVCSDCETRFERRVAWSAADSVDCTACGGSHVRRAVSRVALMGSDSREIPVQAGSGGGCCGGSCGCGGHRA